MCFPTESMNCTGVPFHGGGKLLGCNLLIQSVSLCVKVHVDISGQIAQKNMDSSLGMKRDDGLEFVVFLPVRIKKQYFQKYNTQILHPVEKLHCILIHYCIRDHLEGVTEIIVCPDINFRRLKHLLPLLFKDHPQFKDIHIRHRLKDEPKSNGHKPAIKAYRKQSKADRILNWKMVECKALAFKN
jgi:hypothetical protein